MLLPKGLHSSISFGHLPTQLVKFALDPGRSMLGGTLSIPQVILEIEIGEHVGHRCSGGRLRGLDGEVDSVGFVIVLHPKAGQDLVDDHYSDLVRRHLIRWLLAVHQPVLHGLREEGEHGSRE